MKRNRVVVTGMGILAPNGIGIEPFWESILAGRSGIGPITLFDASEFKSRIAGEVKNFGIRTRRNLPVQTIGMRNLVDIWTRVNETPERVEVIKQRAGVVDHKIDCTDDLFIGSDVAIAIKHEMRKQAGKIVSLFPTATIARAEGGYTVNQSHLRQIEQDACNATVRFRERVKKVVKDTEDVGWGLHDYLLEIYFDFYGDDLEHPTEVASEQRGKVVKIHR